MFRSVLSSVCKASLVQYRTDGLNTVFLLLWSGSIVDEVIFSALIEDFLLVVKQHQWYPGSDAGLAADELLTRSVPLAWNRIGEVMQQPGVVRARAGLVLDENLALRMLVHFINVACDSNLKLKDILRA